ncbi:MAG: hypothetical protein ACTHU0_35435 [Kofleriaceae bacterium]
MFDQDRSMRRWCAVCLFGVVVASGCSKERNPRACLDGICPDLAYPFCDIDGSLEGSPKTCIAVDCEPQSLVACRGDEELRCNADGTNYSIFQCSRGCEDASGCRLCDPNETACTNGKLATCDATGAVVSSEPCPLGCFEDQPRCREIAPSNGLGMYLDMVADPPDVVLRDAKVFADTGVIAEGATTIEVPTFLVSPASNGVPIRVFVTNTLQIDGAHFMMDLGDPRDPPGPAIAFVARREVRLEGSITVDTQVGSAFSGCTHASPGNVHSPTAGTIYSLGGGGGGHATEGSNGGAIIGYDGPVGAKRGEASGSEALIPLRGGCSGGYDLSSNGDSPNGGGAIQFTSGARITVAGVIDVRGFDGNLDHTQDGGTDGLAIGGGGAGGAVLLEAPVVELTGLAHLRASGGNGASGCTSPQRNCSLGGRGATTSMPAAQVADITGNTPDAKQMSGGGGGGLGRIRINTTDGTYVKSSQSIENGAVTTGAIQTR